MYMMVVVESCGWAVALLDRLAVRGGDDFLDVDRRQADRGDLLATAKEVLTADRDNRVALTDRWVDGLDDGGREVGQLAVGQDVLGGAVLQDYGRARVGGDDDVTGRGLAEGGHDPDAGLGRAVDDLGRGRAGELDADGLGAAAEEVDARDGDVRALLAVDGRDLVDGPRHGA